jgi:hypothetical protein
MATEHLDLLGRVVPHRIGPIALMRAIPGFAAQFTKVSAKYVANFNGAYVVSCPCGEEPEVTPGDHILKCACERFYIFTGTALYVANSPVLTSPERTPDDPAPPAVSAAAQDEPADARA